MAVFGAPIEADDHADRALRAAREMLRERLPRFNRWLKENGFRDRFRMGDEHGGPPRVDDKAHASFDPHLRVDPTTSPAALGRSRLRGRGRRPGQAIEDQRLDARRRPTPLSVSVSGVQKGPAHVRAPLCETKASWRGFCRGRSSAGLAKGDDAGGPDGDDKRMKGGALPTLRCQRRRARHARRKHPSRVRSSTRSGYTSEAPPSRALAAPAHHAWIRKPGARKAATSARPITSCRRRSRASSSTLGLHMLVSRFVTVIAS
jgi:hypothetical protein